MSYRINWEKLFNKQIGKFNPCANQYFKNKDHYQFVALVKVEYEKQSILIVTEIKIDFNDACQQRINQFKIKDNERAEHFGCLISITYIQLIICIKNNFKLDTYINDILKEKFGSLPGWKGNCKKYELKHLNKIISVFDKFYNEVSPS